ncbi:MAG: 2-isopropylmalate synthase [Enterobacterales bacterium]
MSQKIIIFDTTLRDGEQSLKSSLTIKSKLIIALALEKMGVDIIEAGFPVSSPEDFKSVNIISKKIKNSIICGLSRCINKDIEIAVEALSSAETFRLHIFLPTSNLQIKSKLNKNFDEIVNMAIKSIKFARHHTDDIEFSCEDACRTNIDNLCRITEFAINAGAKTINFPDTVGYSTPMQYNSIISQLCNKVPNIDKAIISVHCHNDLGMAVGNSVTAIQAGARQIEGTINGIGERAGNAAIEEVVMAIKVRNDLNLHTSINYKEIYNTSKIVSELCNIPIPDHKPIVGTNAFTHSSGIHQDGILKNRENYEIINPKNIGAKLTKLNLTARSGRSAIKYIMSSLGYHKNDFDINKLYKKFLKFADKKGQIFDYDLEALALLDNYDEYILKNYFYLNYFNIQSCSTKTSIVLINMKCGDEIKETIYIDNGSINTICKAIKKITNFNFNIKKYIITEKKNNLNILNKVNITIKHNNKYYYGSEISNDIFESTINAIISTLNNIWRYKKIKTFLNKKT